VADNNQETGLLCLCCIILAVISTSEISKITEVVRTISTAAWFLEWAVIYNSCIHGDIVQ
jgi:hypothetical protein